MAETVEARCGCCRKRFRLRPEQLGQEVLCPHCKTAVRIPRRTKAAEGALHALKAEDRPRRRPAAGHRPRPMSHRRGQSRNLGVVWVVGIGIGLLGAIIGLVFLFGTYSPPESGDAARAEADAARGAADAGADSDAGPSTAMVGGAGRDNDTGAEGETASGPAAGADASADRPTKKQDRTRRPAPNLLPTVKGILRGYADGTVTYVVGRVTNNSDRTIRSMRIVFSLWVSENGEKVGEATAVILNVPPKYTAPVVAECKHAAGLRAKYWKMTSCETAPAGVPVDLPPLETHNAVPVADPNSPKRTGLVRAAVTNHGKVTVIDMLMSALLLNEKGRIVGAARHRLSRKIEPGATEEVEIEWRRTAGRLVRNVEVWVQPHFFREERPVTSQSPAETPAPEEPPSPRGP